MGTVMGTVGAGVGCGLKVEDEGQLGGSVG